MVLPGRPGYIHCDQLPFSFIYVKQSVVSFILWKKNVVQCTHRLKQNPSKLYSYIDLFRFVKTVLLRDAPVMKEFQPLHHPAPGYLPPHHALDVKDQASPHAAV